MTLSIVKYPAGLFEGARIRANARHDEIYPQVKTKRRRGSIVAPTANRTVVRVLWDGTRSHQAVDVRLFEVEERPMGTLSMLNEAGDTTISWTEDRDEEMEQIIQKKMDEGVTFFIVERGRGQTLKKRGAQLEAAADASKHRALVIPDEDLAKFVGSGAGTATAAPDAPVKSSRVSRNAKEIARSESVGVRQRKGG